MAEDEAIRIQVTRDAGDYYFAVAANFWRCGCWLWALVPGLVVGGIVFAQAMADQDPHALAVGVTFGLVCTVATMAFFAILLAWTAWNSWRQPGALDPITYTFTPEAIEVNTTIGASKVQWIVWKRAFETGRLIIIRHRLNLMHLLPKRQISEETQSRLRALLRQTLDGRVAFRPEPGQ